MTKEETTMERDEREGKGEANESLQGRKRVGSERNEKKEETKR